MRKLYEKITFQMNDTHPTVTVAELMRILIDEENNKSFIGKVANDLFRSMNLAQSGLNLDTDDLPL